MSRVFVDVDTQIDFLFPAGALYVPGAERIIPVVAALNHHAARQGVALISTVDAHSESDAEFRLYPPHCVVGTVGQQKPAATLTGGQHFVEKQAVDCFTSPRMEPLLRELDARECVVYGVATDICVRHAAMGLLQRGFKVSLVTDAVRALDAAAAQAFVDAFRAAGGTLVSSGEILRA